MTLDYFYGQSGELFSYFRIPKALFQDHRFRQLSTDARTLYGILLDRMSLSAKNGWLDEQGRVYIIYTVREMQESLCCAEHKAVKLFRELEDTDLIERKRRGLGRPSLIYVKDFSSGLPKAQVQNCTNSNSGAAESAILVQPKPQANKTDKNKTEWNDPDPIYSGGIRKQLEDYFYQALEVDLLLRLCPDEEDALMKNKIIGICPNCGANVVEREKGWFCENRECRFVLWKDNAFFKRLGKRLDGRMADKLLRDGRVRLKDCKSAKGKTYNATVLLGTEPDGRSKFSLEFENGGC